jgi:hypothetical protein
VFGHGSVRRGEYLGGRECANHISTSVLDGSGMIDDAVDFDLRAPEAIPYFSRRIQLAQIQLPPAVQTNTAEDIFDRAGFMLSMGPEFCQRSDECRVGGNGMGG